MIYYDGCCRQLCSKPCQNVFVMKERRIVPCAQCKVKKYNFDMIEKFRSGQVRIPSTIEYYYTGLLQDQPSSLYCSLNCLALHASQGAGQQQVGSGPLPVISAVSSLASQQR